ncbi:tetratricopeptide repeat protein [Oribacterium sp. FC2011]|uniref:tetratricopeptide repeat protein n=1 Tax=Oribacterium sp. FC2011 TaxID=1408311 RepID=UPI0004E12E03|nr:tetratricopeptide repeat protein [Oribacterium sp. FC2011]
MSNKIIVEITYNLKGLRDIIVGDLDLNIDPIRGKDIREWFEPFKGRVSWEGLISECKELLQDDEADLDFIFRGDPENEKILRECLKNYGYTLNSYLNEQTVYEENASEKKSIVDDYNKQSSTEDTLNKAKRMENLGNIDEAIQLYLTLAQKGNAEAQYKYAQLREALLNENKGSHSEHDKYQIFLYYEKAAKQGHPEAMYCLANCYTDSIGVNKNPIEAAKWYENAANLGVVMAMRNIGECYYAGAGVPQNMSLAIEWFKKAVEKGNDLVSARNLGAIYCVDEYGQDLNEAKTWITIAAKGGDAYSQRILAEMSEGSDAIEWLMKSAEQGNADAIFELGKSYLLGNNIEQNSQKAIELFEKAEEANNYGSCFYLGGCYLNGDGTEVDYSKAISYFKKSISQHEKYNDEDYLYEYSASCYMLGLCYYYGYGVDENNTRAVELFEKAADYNHKDALYYLGKCYENGYGVDKNYHEAFHYFLKAAMNEQVDAQLLLGECYMHGELDVGINKSEAFSWYEKAAENDNAIAQEYLAYLYLFGEGVEKNEKLAIEWLLKSAEQNNPSAMESLSECYHDGTGVEKDNLMAFKWCEKAAELGDAQAQYNLGFFYSEGTEVPKDIHKAVALELSGFYGGKNEEKKHYSEILKTCRGREMFDLYQEAADKGSKEAQDRLKNLKKYSN